jgi:putative PIN family toxin of toxin-antitoxin system
MRVVLDTNIFIGACLGVGSARKVVNACLDGYLSPLMSQALINEIESVLGRAGLFESCRLSLEERLDLLDIYLARCEWCKIHFTWRPNLKDEADNHLMELAVAGSANAIVTRNLRDFRFAELKFQGVRICDPEQILRELEP